MVAVIIVALVLGAGLVVAEARLSTHGALGILGVGALIAGIE